MQSPEEHPVSVEVRDAEKRKGLSKYYAYSVEVELNNGTKYFIFRRYKEFHDLNQRLEDRFPVDAGYFNKEERTLPELPKKIIFGRSAVRNVAEQRLPILDTYMRHLFSLPNNIRFDSIVLSFLRQTAQDRSQADDKNILLEQVPIASSPPTRSKPIKTLASGRVCNKVGPSSSPRSPLAVSPQSIKPSYPPPPAPSPKPSHPPPPRPKAPQRPKAPPPVMVKLLPFKHKLEPFRSRMNSYIVDTEDTAAGESDEWEDDETKGKITMYFRGLPRELEVETEVIKKPTYAKLRQVVEETLVYTWVVLNYKDKDGDLVQLTDEDDIRLLKKHSCRVRGAFARDPLHAPWPLYITKAEDYSVYNTHPYQQPSKAF